MSMRIIYLAKAYFMGLVALVIALTSGCTPFDLHEKIFADIEEVPPTPDRIVAMWTDTVMYQPGKPAIRGFGARIFFYGGEEDDPIEVDGSLTVYAFDAEQYVTGLPLPEKKFVFTPEQFVTHHSKSKAGHSYSVWLPWSEVGGPSRHISLIARYEGRVGGVVVSDPSRTVLPGIQNELGDDKTQVGKNKKPPVKDVQLASHDDEKADTAVTINLPPSFAKKLQSQSDDTQSSGNPIGLDSSVEQVEPKQVQESAAEAADSDQSSASPLSYHQQLSDHFPRRRYPVGSSPGWSLNGRAPRREPLRAKWLSALPPTPRSPVISTEDSP